MRKALFLLILILMLSLAPFYVVSAVPTFYCGPPPSVSTSGMPSDVSIWWPMGPHKSEEEAEAIHKLADEGVKINYRLWWWEEPGMPNHTALDIFYNETFREEVKRVIDYNFDLLDPEKLWAVTLSEEEPWWSYLYDKGFPWAIGDLLAKYSDAYCEETGFQLDRSIDPWTEMNETEQVVFTEWINDKTVWVFNHLYDYIKSKYPHLQVFQFIGMGFYTGCPCPPIWAFCKPYEVKADGYIIDHYGDKPWELYECVRMYKTAFPDKEFHIVLWGREWPPDSSTGFEQNTRNAWVAYLAGADAIGWFTWHYAHDWGPHRKDPLGKRLYMYTNRLNRELAKLPVVKPKPQVLAIIGMYGPAPELGLFSELGLFTEYDFVTQRFFADREMDLSKYRLIVIAEWKYYDETVRKLNDYVKDGGNLIFLGGIISERNIYGNETRKTSFMIQRGADVSWAGGHIKMNISKPNILDLEVDYEARSSEALTLQIVNRSENYHPIGDFYLVEEDGTTRELEGHPLVLYHNASNPESGWVLYWGLLKASRSPSFDWGSHQDVSDIRSLYSEAIRAFANFLNTSSLVSTRETEDILITQSKLDDGTVLAGVSNMNLESRSITYSLDLDRLGLPDGEYWVHSLDKNTTEGPFESRASRLEFNVDLAVNGTKLFLISQDKREPTYSIKIFPKIPGVEDIPSASFTFSPTNPSTEDTVGFADTSTDSDGTIVFQHWDFGDGTTSINQDPSHQYAEQGEYIVRLTVTDNDGGRDTAEQVITIHQPDYTFYFVFGGLSIAGAVIAVAIMVRRRKLVKA